MKVTLKIEGPIACGKTFLARFIENQLLEKYSIEFISKTRDGPTDETYCYNIKPL